MSDITSADSSHAIYGGVIVDVVEDSLDKATRLLAGINGGVYKAVGSALTRAATVGKTAAKQPVTSAKASFWFAPETSTILSGKIVAGSPWCLASVGM